MDSLSKRIIKEGKKIMKRVLEGDDSDWIVPRETLKNQLATKIINSSMQHTANQIVSVQPISLPPGWTMDIDPTYTPMNKPRASQKQVDRLARTLMIEDGLLPTHHLTGGKKEDMANALKQLASEKRRVMARKYRKMYRRACKLYPLNDTYFPKHYSHAEKKARHVTYLYRMKARHMIEGDVS
jgi:hypothetical protein